MPELDQLRAIQTLAAVADQGSFTAAARSLGVTPSAVSKLVSRTEAHFGVLLVQRTTRSQSLTEAGARWLSRCRPVLDALEDAEDELRDRRDRLSGTLRVTAPSVLGPLVVAPVVTDFLARWPEVSAETRFTDSYLDLVAEGFDLAVRVARRLPDSGLVGRRVMDYTSILVASPEYLARRGTPRSVAELEAHDGLMLRTSTVESTWDLRGGVARPNPRLLAGDIGELYRAARRGLGIATIPAPWVSRELATGALVEVLPGQLQLDRQIWLLRPSRAYASRRVARFAEALEEALSKPLATGWAGVADL